VKGGGHGDYRLLVLAPASVQEMSDFVKLGFDLAFKYRNPVLILTDGLIGQMMEKVELFEQEPRTTTFDPAWTLTGKTPERERNIVTSLELEALHQEKHNHKLQAKYRLMEKNEVRYEKIHCEDAEYLIIAYGISARVSQKAVKLARAMGIKAGLLRPVTLFPFPNNEISELSDQVQGILCVELSAGQMVEDVKLAVNGKVNVQHFGRYGGVIHSPDEVLHALQHLMSGVKL
jgi:2-oxoglutarate/2-oxoacid ferredoxin oxidoreductase subunit alpha